MPPPRKIDRAMILSAGLALVAENGVESVNARSLAKRLGCSTQPAFSLFPGMDALRQALHDEACARFEADVLSCPPRNSFLRACCLKVVALARDNPNVFRLIYLSKYCRGRDFLETRMSFESNRRIAAELSARFSLANKQCAAILERVSLLVHGIATLVATANVAYSNRRVLSLVDATIRDAATRSLQRKTPR